MSKITVVEAASRWGCCSQLVYRWIKQGRLPVEKIGSFILIDSKTKRPKPRRPGRPKP